jgi:DNA-binding LacI/PurR family transcriptional regulator
MTMRELAKLANVSFSTVSKAFTEAEDVSRETKEYIFKIAKQNGCFGKFYKGKYSKKIIAIITPEIISDYYTIYVEKLRQLIEKNDGIAIISTFHSVVMKVKGAHSQKIAMCLYVNGTKEPKCLIYFLLISIRISRGSK